MPCTEYLYNYGTSFLPAPPVEMLEPVKPSRHRPVIHIHWTLPVMPPNYGRDIKLIGCQLVQLL